MSRGTYDPINKVRIPTCGRESYEVDNALSSSSQNAVENRVITSELNKTFKNTDVIENTIADEDYIPFYDISSTAQKRSLFSNLVSLVKSKISKSDLGLSNVENKSSATIRDEITSSNVTDALGYIPIKNDYIYTESKQISITYNNSRYATFSESIAKSGYTPIGVITFRPSDALNNYITSLYIESNNFQGIIYRTNGMAVSTTITLTATILYKKN